MNVIHAIDTVKRKFVEVGGVVQIPLLKGDSFRAELTPEGIRVDDLGSQPLLPWVVFQETIHLLIEKGGRAERGDAMHGRLGSQFLPLDSIEGHIAHTVYGRRLGDSVFRRITPVACILIWAGVCKHAPSELLFGD